MTELSLEDIEFIKILAVSDSTVLEAGMNEATKTRLDEQIGPILREYHRENTRFSGNIRIRQFQRAGISEDDGKSAIACARRLGVDIS